MKYIFPQRPSLQDPSMMHFFLYYHYGLNRDMSLLGLVKRGGWRSRLNTCLSVYLFLQLTACGSYQNHQLPGWVIQPPPRCAMGSMRSQTSLSLTKLGATTRGRAALSQQIQTRVEGVIRSYIAEGEGLQGEVREEVFMDYSIQSTSTILQGTQAREYFISSDPYQTLYALVCIDQAQISDIFKDLSFMPPQHRAPLRQKASEAFAELEQRFLLPSENRQLNDTKRFQD